MVFPEHTRRKFSLTQLYSNSASFAVLVIFLCLSFSDFPCSHCLTLCRSTDPLSALRWKVSDTTKSSRASFKSWLVVSQGKFISRTPRQFEYSASPEKEYKPNGLTLLQLDCWTWRECEQRTKVLTESSVQRLSVVLQTSRLWPPGSCKRLPCVKNSQRENRRVEMGESNSSRCVCVRS